MGFSIYLQGYFPISSMPFDDEIHRDEDGILMFCKILRMNPDAYRQKDSGMRGVLSFHCLFVRTMHV